MANEYVTAAQVKATLSLTGQSFADPDIDAARAAASRGIEDACRRRFWLDADANQVRYYTPTGPRVAFINDVVTITSVKADCDGDGVFETTLTQNTDYVAGPLNATADGKPFEVLETHPRGVTLFPHMYPRSLEVTGKFGWPEVPAGVVQAATIITVKLLRRAREAPFGIVQVGLDGDAVRLARTDPDVAFLLEPVTRVEGVLV